MSQGLASRHQYVHGAGETGEILRSRGAQPSLEKPVEDGRVEDDVADGDSWYNYSLAENKVSKPT